MLLTAYLPMSNMSTTVVSAPRRVIAHQLALGFGLVSSVAIGMCAMLISLIGQVSALVDGMQEDEVAIRESLSLSVAVREQYIHQAHWMIERDVEHLHHYEDWLTRIASSLAVIRPLVPSDSLWRVEQLAADSAALDALFENSVAPAVRRGDSESVVRLHREADALAARAAAHADALGLTVANRMAHAHVDATHATNLGLLTGAVCVLLVLMLSVGFTLRLRRAVVKPLAVLSDAARNFGAGRFDIRLGAVGIGELRAVGEAFDKMAEELQAREKQIVEKERMAAIGQLAAGIAHEINNPIQIIRGYLKTMATDGCSEEFVDELRIIDEEAAACQRIADDLVAYARTPELRRQDVVMSELIAESARRLSETHKVPHAVEVSADAATLHVDPDRIRQVLLNLLLNASQVSADGTPIEVRGAAGNSSYEIAIADRGPGIDPHNIERVFEPFFSQRAGGTGLGLAVCRGIVDAHGGTIEAHARSGGGTTFTVRLPNTQAETVSTS